MRQGRSPSGGNRGAPWDQSSELNPGPSLSFNAIIHILSCLGQWKEHALLFLEVFALHWQGHANQPYRVLHLLSSLQPPRALCILQGYSANLSEMCPGSIHRATRAVSHLPPELDILAGLYSPFPEPLSTTHPTPCRLLLQENPPIPSASSPLWQHHGPPSWETSALLICLKTRRFQPNSHS